MSLRQRLVRLFPSAGASQGASRDASSGPEVAAPAAGGALAGGSLRLRLMLGAGLWVSVALVVALAVMQQLFVRQVEDQVVERLTLDLDQLAANLETGDNGALTLTGQLSESRFQRPLSGLYWQVQSLDGREMLRSRSLWDGVLTLPAREAGEEDNGGGNRGQIHSHHLTGPSGALLLLLERQITLPEDDRKVQLAVAWDMSRMSTLFDSFLKTLIVSFSVLAVGLMGAAWAQVTYGLVPLERLRLALGRIGEGDSNRLQGTWPREVMPLVDDLNAMLERNQRMMTSAQEAAGNLAHALKTPLAIIANEAGSLSGHGDTSGAALLGQQVEVMRRHIDHHLARARAQAAGEARGVRTPALPSLQRLARVLGRLHGRGIAVAGEGAPAFRGDSQTLEEILGNLLENACKWSVCNIIATASREQAGGQAWLKLEIEDDGPGIPPELVEDVLRRGRRLDESKPGSGLGLSIVDDLTRAAGGSLRLDRSPSLGGLRASLLLPSVPG